MNTVDYIKQYSQLYSDYKSNCPNELSDLDSVMEQYNYIETPSRSELPEQIELHMFWRIPLPPGLIGELEFCIEQGVFFKRNPDVYYYVSKKYWPLVRHFTGAALVCRVAKADDFTYSMELYKKAPLYFELTEDNYNSFECLKHVKPFSYLSRILNLECLKYAVEHLLCRIDTSYIVRHGMLDCITYANEYCGRIVPITELKTLMQRGHVACVKYVRDQYSAKYDTAGAVMAIKCDQPECFLYFQEYDISTAAGYIGNSTGCLMLMRNHPEWTRNLADVMQSVCYHDNIECLILLYPEYITHYDDADDLFEAAVRGGSVRCLEYLSTRIEEVYINVDFISSFKVYKYLHRKGIIDPAEGHDDRCYTAYSIKFATYIYKHRGGFYWLGSESVDYVTLKCVQYAYSTGYRDEELPYYALHSKRLDIFIYLYDYHKSTVDFVGQAIEAYNFKAIQLLHKRRVPWGNSIKKALSPDHFEIAKYMYDRGARCKNFQKKCIKHKNFTLFLYAHMHESQ